MDSDVCVVDIVTVDDAFEIWHLHCWRGNYRHKHVLHSTVGSTQRIYEFRIAATINRRQFPTQLNQFVFVMDTRCFPWGRKSICTQYLERRILRPATSKLHFLVFHCIKAKSKMPPKFQSLLYDSHSKFVPSQHFALFSEQRPNSATPFKTRSLQRKIFSVRC